MSDLSPPIRRVSRPVLIACYGLLAIIIAFELVVTWLALHPNVPDDYRAYFITQTTTCLPQPVSGTYTLGQTISFLGEGREAAKLVKVCGWEGPVGDGTHALGDTTRMRFVYTQPATSLVMHLTMTAIDRAVDGQKVELVVNGTSIGTLDVKPGEPQDFTLAVPADVVKAAAGKLEVFFELRTAMKMDPTDSSTRKRSVRIYSIRLDPVA